MLVAYTPLRYPDVFASLEALKECLKEERGGKRPRREISDHWPVAMDEKGLWTDFRWWVFQVFAGDSRDFSNHHQKLMEEIERDPSLWEVRCPSLHDYDTLLGNLMEVYGKHMGAGPRMGVRTGPSPTMQDHPLIGFLDGKTNAQLQEFEDRGRTLLDLATLHQQWEMAEELWNRGVRWSSSHMESGHALEGIIVGWTWLRESPMEGWLQGANSNQTHSLRVQWLDTWLERYESFGVPHPQKAQLDRRYRAHQESGMSCDRFLDTPATLFISRMFHVEGPRTRGLSTMPAFARQMLDRWLDFWDSQQVDLAAQRIPKPAMWEGAPEETTGMLEHWDMPGLEEIFQERNMKRHLPQAPNKKARPGARF